MSSDGMSRKDLAYAIAESDAISVALAITGQDNLVIVGEKFARQPISDRNFASALPAKLQHGAEGVIRWSGNGAASCKIRNGGVNVGRLELVVLLLPKWVRWGYFGHRRSGG